MKLYAIISTLVIFFLLFWVFEQKTTNDIVIHDLQQSKRFHVERADSLRIYIEKAKDSLSIAFATIRGLNMEREAAHQETQKWVKRYNFEKSMRLGIKTPAGYDSILSSLYPQ